MAEAMRRRWLGSGTMPAKYGSWNASHGLVVLEMSGSRLSLRLRPKFLAKFLEIGALEAAPGDGTVILPAKWAWKLGIEFRRPGSPSYYLWTAWHAEIFSCLSDAGFEVLPAEGQ